MSVRLEVWPGCGFLGVSGSVCASLCLRGCAVISVYVLSVSVLRQSLCLCASFLYAASLYISFFLLSLFFFSFFAFAFLLVDCFVVSGVGVMCVCARARVFGSCVVYTKITRACTREIEIAKLRTDGNPRCGAQA